MIYHIENGEKEDDINTIFVYSDNYGYRSINVVKAAIELERNFIIERCFQNDMRIKFDNGYIYDINNKYSIFKENIVGCNVTKSKSLTSYLLNSHGIKVPKQKLFYTEDLSQLNNFIEEIKYPICLKPDNRCESIDVFCCVKNEKELDKIINFYKSLYKKFVVEKSIPGNVYRLYYCYGEIIGVIRKNKSFVIGDGMNTIQNLVNKKYNFTEFEKCYKEYSLILERLKLSRNNILPLGKRLYISDTAPGDEFEDFNIKRLDTYYEKLVLSVSKAIGLNIFAIDLIAESLNKVKKCMPTVLEIQEGPEFGRKNSNIDKYYKKIIEQLSS